MLPRNKMTGLLPLPTKGYYSEETQMARSLTIKNSSHPKWNEEFVL